MAQTNYTPISLYYSTTASAVPTAANLVPGELAINTNDGKLYYEDSSGVVQVLATKSTGSIGGSNTQVQFNNSGSLGGSSSFTWDGTTVTATKFGGALNGTVGATTASTGAFTTLSTSSTTTLSGLTASTALALDASKNVVSVTNTGTGNNVLSASPTLTGTIAGASLSLSSLTSGRVTYAGASGLLSDSANLTWDNTNARLGIGTASPTAKLDLGGNTALTVQQIFSRGVSDSDFNVRFTNGSAGTAAFIGTLGLDYGNGAFADMAAIKFYRNSLAGELAFFASTSAASGTERMRLTSTGLGIGTSSPNEKLEVTGSIRVSNGLTGAFYADQSTNGGYKIRNFANSAYATMAYFDNDDVLVLRGGKATAGVSIRNFGNSSEILLTSDTGVAITGTLSTTGIVTMSAYGAGAATFSASGVISSVSDETWKTKDGVPTNTNAMLQKLEPGYWFYNEEKAPIFGEERQLGFYAQNVHEAIGEEAAPTPEEGKPWGYYDRSVLAVTVMSLKNALNTIEELKQRITALENK